MLFDNDHNGWNEYQKLVMSEIKRLDSNLSAINQKVDQIRVHDLSNIVSEIKLLRYKSTLWGAVAGGIPVLIIILSRLIGLL